MSRADGAVLGVRKLVDNGPSSRRWDLVILGDGYRQDEIEQYERNVTAIVQAFLATDPIEALQVAINVHRVNVVSRDTGAGDLCSGEQRGTYFDSNFCFEGISRLLVSNAATALDVALEVVPQMNATLIVVNSTTYGGSGGAVATCSVAPAAIEIALHEMGHSQFGLADEYAFLSDCHEPGHDLYSGGEPVEPNVTMKVDTLKWANLVTPGTRVPTTRNPDCSECDRQPSPVPAGTVGAFEGARYFRCGMFRPAFSCRMRQLGTPFCAVCKDRIRRVLAPFLPKSRIVRRR